MRTMNELFADLVATLEGLLDISYRTPMWSPFPPSDAFDPKWNTADQAFSDCVRRAGIDLVFENPTAFQNASMALVDLSNPLSPRYAGFLDKAEVSIGSVAKICAMYAAYQLREDCRFLAKSLSSMNDPASVAQAVLAKSLTKWNDPGNPPYIQAIVPSPPKLDKIFDFTQESDGWHVDFRRTPAQTPTGEGNPTDAGTIVEIKSNLDKLDNDVDDAPTWQARSTLMTQVNFLEWLRLMIGFSNNTAAGFCIRNLGWPYIGALMQQTGLFDPNASEGLWLATDYDPKNTWSGQLVRGPVKSGSSTLSETEHGGDAKSLAKFFTLLEQGSLVTAAACTEMNGLLDGTLWRGATSFLGGNIPLGGSNKVCTKIGILGDVIHDAGWIQNGALSYVAVVLNVINPTNDGVPIEGARLKLEACLSA